MSERVYRAVPFVTAALAGLCAQPRQHVPESIAKAAVEIGLATAAKLEEEAAKGGGEVHDDAPEALSGDHLRELVHALVRQELDALTQPQPTKPPEA